ncbi:unnamed protein product [Clonostachys chloroleuca]|uniref:Uncharacterized protein n=1 Tax=Clonostachys chloroleuca TaxID=1926264 RepID=A0AA35MDB0_9HYPO|nr:unnamed protein product [Clonostachys chloroleuca]
MASDHQDSSFRLLFRLIPESSSAKTCSSDKPSPSHEIKIGLNYSRRGSTTLATIGRDPASDIVIDDPLISRLHCSFEINPANGIIFLVDRSRFGSTDVGGEKSSGFPRTTQREVVVLPGFNDMLFLCGKQGYRYFIQWRLDAATVVKHVRAFVDTLAPGPPHRALTLEVGDEYRTNRIGADDALTAVQSRAMSRLYTPGAEPQEMAWAKIETIQKKLYGRVFRAANAFTGGVIAVKKIKAKAVGGSRSSLVQLEKTVESLRDISHEHIVRIFASTGWCDGKLEIAMELKDGNLQSLVNSWRDREMHPSAIDALGLKAMYHSLLGLKWLHHRHFIHGSVAPHNILFTQKNDNVNSIHSFHFALADFGLSTADPRDEYNQIFIAPERHYPDRRSSRKSDIWSLYVTMLMVLRVDDDFSFNIRSYDMEMGQHFDNVVQTAKSTTGSLQNLHVMARQNPDERWSANEVLEHFFKQGFFVDRPLPPSDLLPRDRRQYGPSSYKAPRRNLTRQSTMEKLKQTGDNILRRITGDISDAVGRRGMTFRGHD